MAAMSSESTVLILGAGINGAAIARELALNGVGVAVVDERDLAAGTTSYSSRLVHGGLRYLEHGDFELVRESLQERTRWLRLAPHLVRPLRLFIPIENRFGGFGAAVRSFLGMRPGKGRKRQGKPRGLWTVRAGLWLYDRYAQDRSLARSQAFRLPSKRAPAVNREKYRWACAYYDAQLRFPERFTLELLVDARDAAMHTGANFRLYTYHHVRKRGRDIEIIPNGLDIPTTTLRPSAIVNATGAWADSTLAELGVPSTPLIGGTKGAHLITYRRELVEQLGGDAIYAEAQDGRPIFLLPFGEGVLVGTTDEPFSGDPDSVRCSPAEVRYLIDAVSQVFPQLELGEEDVDLVYCGVRPLPASGPTTPAAITRRHWLVNHENQDVPTYSVVGGKLTTCRSLAESAADTILDRLGRKRIASSRDLPLPGGRLVELSDSDDLADRGDLVDRGQTADRNDATWQPGGLSGGTMAAVGALDGARAKLVLRAAIGDCESNKTGAVELLDGTAFPVAIARYMADHEWVRRIDDFVERRLMLLYHRRLTRQCLQQLALVLVEAKALGLDEMESAVAAVEARLKERFQKCVC